MKELVLSFLIVFIFSANSWCRPVRIGMSLSLTGRYATIATLQEKGFRLWETEVNARGGLLGRKVQLSIYDDQSDGAKAGAIYRRMIAEEKMDLLFAPYSSPITMAVLPFTEAAGYPMLASGAASDQIWELGYRYIFGIYPPASRFSLPFLEMALSSGLTKIAIMAADDPFSTYVKNGVLVWARRLGLEVVYQNVFKKGMKDFRPLAEEVKKAEPEVLLLATHFEETVLMRKALDGTGWYPKAYWATVGPGLGAYKDNLGSLADETFFTSQWFHYSKLPFPGSASFYQRFVSAYGVEPSYQAAHAFSSGLILEKAIENANSLARESIRNAFSNMETMTPLGRYGVNSDGKQVRAFQLILQWQNGKKEVVWPVKLRTRPPLIGGKEE